MRINFLNEEEVTQNSGVADMLMSAINTKWNTISELTSMSVNLEDEGYTDFIDVINEIIEDENKNIGKLQHLLSIVSPSTENIEDGEQEAEDALSESLDKDEMARITPEINKFVESQGFTVDKG